MIFGRQPQGDAPVLFPMAEISVRGRMRGVSWLFATLLVFVPFTVLSAGCGGGNSSSGPGNSVSSQKALVTGRLVDQYSDNAPIVGATVRLNGEAVVTGADGAFSLSISSGQATAKLTVQAPASVSYYNTGNVGGQPYDLRNDGIPVPTLSPNQNFAIGDVVMYSEAGPPPPPIL